MIRIVLLFILLFIIYCLIRCLIQKKIYLIFQGRTCLFQNKNNNIFLLMYVVFVRYLFVTIVFESYFGHHTTSTILLFIVCRFFVGKTLLLSNVSWDLISCFPCRLDGLHKNQPHNKQEVNQTQKNTTTTKTFDNQHQHHDEHAV